MYLQVCQSFEDVFTHFSETSIVIHLLNALMLILLYIFSSIFSLFNESDLQGIYYYYLLYTHREI